MSRRPFDIEDIFIGERHRHPDMKKVEEIARSISDVGLLNAPAVCMRDDVTMPDGEVCDSAPVLIFGRHRLLALQSLGHTVVECEVYEVDDLRAELMEIDENLARSELSPAEEASHIARRKAIWEKLNGEKTGERNPSSSLSDGRKSGPQHQKQFAAELADVTGDSKTQINVKIARARDLGDDINRIVGTSLDKGVEMDALAKLPEKERENLISRAESGEKVSARPAQENKPITADKAFEIIANGVVANPLISKSVDDEEQEFWRFWASLSIGAKRRIMPQIIALNGTFGK